MKKNIVGWSIVILCPIIVLLEGWFLFHPQPKLKSSVPLHIKTYPALTRTHIKLGTKVTYNSDPPTSGPHYPDWAKSGVYDKPVDDRFLVHSLEHGYIIISYDCQTSQNPLSFSDCSSLKKQLSDIAQEKKLWKLIVVPRPKLDTKIALTAWTHLDNMNRLQTEEVKGFIDEFRDQGPEKTFN